MEIKEFVAKYQAKAHEFRKYLLLVDSLMEPLAKKYDSLEKIVNGTITITGNDDDELLAIHTGAELSKMQIMFYEKVCKIIKDLEKIRDAVNPNEKGELK